MKKKESIQTAAISRFFSAAVLKELAQNGKSPLLIRLLKESGLRIEEYSLSKIGDLFDVAHGILAHKSNRHEYVYKSAIANKILLGTHSLNTASMITEFRTGSCKADVVVLNGTSCAYEVKSVRDSLARLKDQISEYLNVFAAVNVISGENHLQQVFDMVPDTVGVLRLTERNQISTLRKPLIDVKRTKASAVFDCITLKEAELVLYKYAINIPKVPNTKMYCTLRDLFLGLSSEEAQKGMVEVLKKTRSLAPMKSLVANLPVSLNALVFSAKFRRQDHSLLIETLNTPIKKAMDWR